MDGNSSLKKYQDTEAARVRAYGKNAGMDVPAKYAKGGAVKGAKTNITIVVGKDKGSDNGGLGALAALAAAKPKAPPVIAPPAGGPPPAPGAGPGAPPPMAGGPPMPGMGMKTGGRATAIPMTAGSESGPGRAQKSASEAKKEGRAARPTPSRKA